MSPEVLAQSALGAGGGLGDLADGELFRVAGTDAGQGTVEEGVGGGSRGRGAGVQRWQDTVAEVEEEDFPEKGTAEFAMPGEFLFALHANSFQARGKGWGLGGRREDGGVECELERAIADAKFDVEGAQEGVGAEAVGVTGPNQTKLATDHVEGLFAEGEDAAAVEKGDDLEIVVLVQAQNPVGGVVVAGDPENVEAGGEERLGIHMFYYSLERLPFWIKDAPIRGKKERLH